MADEKKEKTKQSEIENIKKERDEYLKGWQKERADFINYKKEEKERFKEIIRFSNERIIKSLIAVLNSFDLAIESLLKQNKDKEQKVKKLNDTYLKGIYLIREQLEDILQKEGVEKIEAKKGDIFNPSYHEAIAEIENSELPPHTILEVLEKGYVLNGKVIRPCRVTVTKA